MGFDCRPGVRSNVMVRTGTYRRSSKQLEGDYFCGWNPRKGCENLLWCIWFFSKGAGRIFSSSGTLTSSLYKIVVHPTTAGDIWVYWTQIGNLQGHLKRLLGMGHMTWRCSSSDPWGLCPLGEGVMFSRTP